MSDNNDVKKTFNPTLARGYEMSRGYWSPPLTSEDYDAIMKNVEIGGRMVLKRTTVRKTDKSPDAYFEFVTAAEVKRMEDERNGRKPAHNSEDI